MEVMAQLLSAECQRLSALLDRDRISEYDRERLDKLIRMEMNTAGMKFALAHLMRILRDYYGKI